MSAVLHDRAQVRVVNRSRDLVLAERADVAANPWRRMRGLLGRPPLTAGQGLIILPCQGVHSIGMAYPIDVVYLDRPGVVRRVLHRLSPGRIGPIDWRSRLVLELPAGAAVTTAEGDQLILEPLEADNTPEVR